MRAFTILIAGGATLLASPVRAQDQDAQIWPTLNVNVALNDDLALNTQSVARFGDDADGLYELEVQLDLEATVGDGVKVGGGYVYSPAIRQGDITTTEQRVRQHVSARLGNVLGGRLEGRLRIEQRWRNDSDEVAVRLRPYLMWTRPIGPNGLAVRVWHESFIDLNRTDWTGEARYARSRSQLSLRRKLGGPVTGEIGYINQYSIRSSGPDQLVHALSLALTFEF